VPRETYKHACFDPSDLASIKKIGSLSEGSVPVIFISMGCNEFPNFVRHSKACGGGSRMMQHSYIHRHNTKEDTTSKNRGSILFFEHK
jgi:hypothetical protein